MLSIVRSAQLVLVYCLADDCRFLTARFFEVSILLSSVENLR